MSIADKLGFGPKREYTDQANGTVLVSVTPPAILKLPMQTVRLTANQFARYLTWRGGNGLIQDMLPELSADQREILQSGIGPEDFARLYREED